MPVTIEINGQMVTLEDNEVQTVLRRLVSEFRQRVWLPASSSFIYRYGRWEWHYNERNHPIHWVIEAVGGADLPQAGTARRLKRRHDQLARLMNPQSISQFFAGFNNWQRDAARFRQSMRQYLNDFDAGGGTSVQILTITRDASFVTLQVCAALSTGGASVSASAAAAAATQGAGAALVRSAATTFVVNEIRNGATRLGRTMAGETVTVQDTLNEIGGSALSSVSDAMLGEILGHFMRPLKDMVTQAAMREIRSGRMMNGVTLEIANDRFAAAVADSITAMQRRPRDLRQALQDTPQARSPDAAARSTSQHLMANRNYRAELVRRLEIEQRRASR